jgi:outer membrane protein assembly factor BamB
MTRLLRVLALLASALAASADEYPQWLGPRRDGVYREAGVLATFPAGGPKVLWRTPVANGYSQPAVAPGRVICTDHQLAAGLKLPTNAFSTPTLAGVERVHCFDDETGKEIWRVDYDCPYTISYASGPRATPVIDEGRVYTFGTMGHLYCTDLATGKVIWNKRVGGTAPHWGFSASPVVEGDLVIVLCSGKPLLTAFDKRTGDVAWTAVESKDPGYSPPMTHTVHGRRQVVQWYPNGLIALDPRTGKTIWEMPYGPARVGVTIATPLLIDGDTFVVSTQYEGTSAIQVDKEQRPKLLWHVGGPETDLTTLHALHAPMAYADGRIFGVNHMGQLACVDPANGRVTWSDNRATLGEAKPVKWTAAFLTPYRPDDGAPVKQFFIANERGEFIVAELTAKGYAERARAKLLEPTNNDAKRPVVWAHPAYAHKSAYWRNDKELIRVSLEAP